MTITIPPQLELQLVDKAEAAGLTVQRYIERLILLDIDWHEFKTQDQSLEPDAEYEELRSSVI